MKNDIVRHNLMNDKMYRPYCGNPKCKTMPRSHFNGKQFECKKCGWVSEFPASFITTYKKQWRLPLL